MSVDPASAAALRHPIHIAATGNTFGGITATATGARHGDARSIDVTLAHGSGRVVQDEISITRNADGTVTRNSTRQNANGGVVTTALTYGAPQNGEREVSGTVTRANGAVDQVAGTTTRTKTGHDAAVSLTDAAGHTATRTTSLYRAGPTATLDVSQTDFSGKTISHDETATLVRIGTPVFPG